MDQQYEYKNVVGRLKDKHLNKYSEQGWELVSSKRRTFPVLFPPTDYVFRRIKQESEPKKDTVNKEENKIEKKYSERSSAYVCGIIFLLIGIGAFSSSVWAGLMMVLASIFILPPTAKLISKAIKKPLRRNTRIGIAFWLIVVASITGLIGIGNSQSNSKATTQSAVVNTPSEALTPTEKVASITQSEIQQSASSWGTYSDTTIDDDWSPAPKDTKYVTVKINTGVLWNEDSTITDTGVLSSQIFQKVFPVDKNFYDVQVMYYGTTTDQYGNATSSLLMSYEMDRPLYSKINWSGIADVENDVHLCAFLREQFNSMSQSDQDKDIAVGCLVAPYNLRSAENAIETSSPQYKDIPQYPN